MPGTASRASILVLFWALSAASQDPESTRADTARQLRLEYADATGIKDPARRRDKCKQISTKAVLAGEDTIHDNAAKCAEKAQEEYEKQKAVTDREEQDRNAADTRKQQSSSEVSKATELLQSGSGGCAAAEAHLNKARTLGASGVRFEAASRALQACQSANSRLWYTLYGGGGLLAIAGIIAFFRKFTNREPCIEIIKGPGKGEKFPLRDSLLVGANEKTPEGERVDIVLDDPSLVLSKLHCEIHMRGRQVLVTDLSRNGTFVGGQKLRRDRDTPIRNGDVIDLAGVAKLRFGYQKKES